MKLLLPQTIKDRIQEKCPKRRLRESFVVSDLHKPLQGFIEKELNSLSSRLYQIYKGFEGLSEKTLWYAFSDKGEINDGAEDNLRDLLCYFGFMKNWVDTLAEVTIPEKDVIEWTHKVKGKKNIQNKPQTFSSSESNRVKVAASIQRVYIELTTRKAALPIDIENDVIIEIYDSWYKLFCLIRDELTQLPLMGIEESNVLLISLNEVLRPHLTEHQAKFRHWFENAKKETIAKRFTPQELQKQYPKYKTLISSMKKTNKRLLMLADEINSLRNNNM